ncbi:hypothetical protein [Marinobacterium iners]|uniref:Uncharacterized protein n=1 Tax=Marinobacterium iners DSM 11526 TaxID=1122198 RepID=A0A1H3X8Q4_9GAMM|nr:hypothetical protein [Marinobacterium iners]SDZ95776.1 hypothetical protein SAMN02745729_10177 [Marinobacterium iners DSM 11526]
MTDLLARPVAANLELVGKNMKLQEQVEALQQQLVEQKRAHVDELSMLHHQRQDPIQHAIGILQEHQQHQQALIEARQQVEQLNDELQVANKAASDTLDLVEEARNQRNHYQQQCEQLQAQHSKETRKAQAEITRQAAQLTLATAELKELRELNPKKLAKQVKRLQEENRSKQTTIDTQNKRLAEATRKAKQADAFEKENKDLRTVNRKLNDAIMLTAQDAEAGKLTDVLEEDKQGGWQIASDKGSIEQVYIIDSKSDTCRPYHRVNGLTKIRPVPPKVTALAEKALAGMAELTDMVARATGEDQ